MQLVKTFSILGLLIGSIFFALSLTPSLIPRSNFMQGILAAMAFTVGYVLGVFLCWLWRYLEIPCLRTTPWQRRLFDRSVLIFCVVLIVAFLWRGVQWQNSIRALMGMEAVTSIGALSVGLTALLGFLLLWALGKGFQRIMHLVARRVEQHVPERVAVLIGASAAILLYWAVFNGVLLKTGLHIIEVVYEGFDSVTSEGLTPPTKVTKSGGVKSEVSWIDLGHFGRRFLVLGPTAADIREVAGSGIEPIRVFVGLQSASTPIKRAELALEELKRTGAFEREILLLATPTGAGWLDPGAVNSLEFLYRGNTAIVAGQYSFLPSPVALWADDTYGLESARALFKVIYDYWVTLPADGRPRFYLFGLSLGAQLSENSFDFYDIIDDPIGGALWAGPPFGTGLWARITNNRDPGTPAWLPQFKGGSVVRFGNQYGGYIGQEPWGRFRIAYLQHASDPIVFFDIRWVVQKPGWLDTPRGPDVSPDLKWYPIVTGLQLFADLNVGIAPLSFGHRYTPKGYTEAWLALTEPENWSGEALERLEAKLKTYNVR
ncbi:alpha/beta-hydrolase family protein [Microbulbifer sp. OS29]|uniref:Alpha/beta-hydrolase family protein n=1 Tax=Microbulbifer okhotskensis TaxID=2926617 RepID=A0A9X2ES84_9GAMM|nr:alpha/beta-hydrolase family protein [Microbulbifer okhotskensis]MCO1334791.1 alpha/beta-hydrolase family protein [Microbulbifer okhotskensis]